MLTDIRYAVRILMKNRGVTAAATLSLALGLGAVTTVFCWIQNVVLQPLPGVTRPGELVVLTPTRGQTVIETISYPDVKDMRSLTDVFVGIVVSQITPACIGVAGQKEWIVGEITSANFFDVFGVKPLLGRTFLPEEETKPGGHPVLVLSEGFWKRRFGGNPGVIGSTVDLNSRPFTIIGVAPATFGGDINAVANDFWAPVMMHEEVANFGNLVDREDRWLFGHARLRPGVTRAQAQAALDIFAAQLRDAYPATNREIGFRLFPLSSAPYGGTAILYPVLVILFAAALVVLLIVAANIANLLLARAVGRRKEVAVRLAMGIGRARLIRQFLVESLLLSLLGACGAFLLSSWMVDWINFLMPKTHLPIGYSFHPGINTFGFTIGVAVLTAALFGIFPALHSVRGNASVALKEDGRGTGAASHQQLRSTLVVSEIALALVALVAAGLFLKAFAQARAVDPGFNPKGIVVARMRLGAHGYNEKTGKVFYEKLQARLANLPGVESAALASYMPLGYEGGPGRKLEIEGYTPQPNENMGASISILSPGYFATMQIPILEGRDFTPQDDDSRRSVIINQTLARRFWPGQSALGRKLTVESRRVEVVGVVKDGKYRNLDEAPRPFLYWPYKMHVPDLDLGIVLRGSRSLADISAALRNEVHTLDSGVEAWAIYPMTEYILPAVSRQSLAADLLIVLGLIALLLSAMGVYAVMAYAVSQRTQEIGIRVTLGAQRMDVIRMILRQGAALGIAGIGLGLVGAFATTRLLVQYLFGVSPLDPETFLAVVALLALVVVAACYFPARRATKVDPLLAIRSL
jgi:predicted permease